MYGSSNFINLGCEAIIRGATEIIAGIGDSGIGIATQMPNRDNSIIRSMAAKPEKLYRSRGSIDNILSEILLRLHLKKLSLCIPRYDARRIVKDYDFSLGMGGDNYCYRGREYFYRMNNGMRSNHSKNIFWGCSIEPLDIDDMMLRDLRGYDKIFARESLTLTALRNVGLINVELCTDPAFAMKSAPLVLPHQLDDPSKSFIGINLSPLIFSYASEPLKVRTSILAVLHKILNNTEYGICFIPHVYGRGNDIDINKSFAAALGDESDRVICFEQEVTAPQIKTLIGKMSGLICARTHASIAAYSSCVPTFVLGYSIKSKGIAKDIYGSYEDHVIPVQSIDEEKKLVNAISAFLARIPNEKKYLDRKIPEYIKNAYTICQALRN